MCYACKNCGKCRPPEKPLEPGYKKCAICREHIKEELMVCPHCGFKYPTPPGCAQ